MRIWLASYKAHALRLGVLALASYGAFYFSYKWYALPDPDFLEYYARTDLDPLNFAQGTTPHILRQGSAVLTWLIYHSGLYYPSSIAFHAPGVDQRLFFSALLANYIGLLTAAALAGSIAIRQGASFVGAILAGLLCLFSFGGQNFVLTGLTEGVTWALVAGLYLLFLRENRIAFAALLLFSILQREMITVLFGTLAGFSYFFEKRRRGYLLFVLLTSVACFCAYLVIRKVLIPNDQAQLSITYMLGNIASGRIDRTVIFQALLSQNVVLLTVILAVPLALNGVSCLASVPPLLLTFGVLLAVGYIEGEQAGDLGRIAAILTPVFAAAAASSIDRFRRDDLGVVGTEERQSR